MVLVMSYCGLGSLPNSIRGIPQWITTWKPHASCSVGIGGATGAANLATFNSDKLSSGYFFSIGDGDNITFFSEGDSFLGMPNTVGVLVGPGIGVSWGPLTCTTVAVSL